MNKKIRGFFASTSEMIISFDKFPQPIQLNFNKQTEVKSYIGILMTAVVYGVMFAYILRMGQILVHREDPDVSLFTQIDYFDEKETIDLQETSFKVAFGLYDLKT